MQSKRWAFVDIFSRLVDKLWGVNTKTPWLSRLLFFSCWLTAHAGLASFETTQQQDNVGLVRQQVLAGYKFFGVHWDSLNLGDVTLQARWTQTLLKDSIDAFPSAAYPTSGLTASWERAFSHLSLRADGGMTELKAQGWMGGLKAEYQLTESFKVSGEAQSQLMDGSIFSREVRSSKVGSAVSFSLNNMQLWAELGGSADVRQGGIQPAIARILSLPNNLLLNQYFWLAKGLPLGTTLGVSGIHNTSKYDLYQATSLSATYDSTLTFASYPYGAPLDEWIASAILGIAHEWKISTQTFGGRITAVIPVWSVTKVRWNSVYLADPAYYGNVNNIAKLRIEFLGYASINDAWYINLPCAVESVPNVSRGYFKSTAWNSLEIGIKIQHAF